MAYIYRALSEADIRFNPEVNGLVSKKIVDEVVREDLDTYLGIIKYSCGGLTRKEYYDMFRRLKANFLDGRYEEIKEYASSKVKENADKILNLMANPEDKEAIKDFYSIFTDVNTHVGKGNNTDTNWISFSKSLERCFGYYVEQPNIHRLAIIDSNINNCFDNGLIALDLSNTEEIKKIKHVLITKDFYYTKPNSLFMNYAKASKEIIYRDYIPSDRIIGVLGTLETELLVNDAFDLELLKHKCYRYTWLNMVKYSIMQKLIDENSSLLDFYEEVYIQDRVLDSLIRYEDVDRSELLNMKKYILSKYNEIELDLPFKKELKKEIILPDNYSKNS